MTNSKKVKIHTVYKNKKGERVPSVTTILSLLAKPALIHWAWDLGKQGIDYRKKRDEAGDIGTLAHYLIECDIKGIKPDVSEYSPANLDKAENAYLAWLQWKDSLGKIETVASEKQLVCNNFGGTLDWVIKKQNDFILVDFKTSSNIYFEMACQLGAYQYLWNFNHHFSQQITTCYILRIGKENGEFEQRKYTDLYKETEIFFHLLKVYQLKKEIEKGD